MKGLFVSLLLLGVVLAQTNFNNTCQKDSLLPLLATGTINLNPLDTYNNGANKDYYQSLSLAQFSTVEVLGYGFALTGFQTGCSNNYYTLIIDNVDFQNQNTRMRVTVNFRNPGDGTITLWNLVSFSYIVVSRSFSGTYSDIWATITSVSNPPNNVNIAGPLGARAFDIIGTYYGAAKSQCGIYQDPNVVSFGTANAACGGVPATTAAAGGATVIHAYIMGFQYNPAKDTANYLFASVLPQLAANAAGTPADQTNNVVTVQAVAPAPNGPTVVFNNPKLAMQFIKIAFVLSRLDNARPNYPTGSTYLIYSSSYIFTPVTTFNTPVAVTRGTGVAYNQNYYHLPDTRYAIYGITQFFIPKASNTTCSTISVNATLNSIDAFTITTPNTNPTNFFFQADIFTVNIDKLCVPTTAGSTLFKSANTVGQQSYFTVPTQSVQQYILQDPQSAPITPPVIAAGAPGAITQNVFTATGSAFNFEYYGAKNGNNDTILFQTQIPFIGLTAGQPLKFEFGFFDFVSAPAGLFSLNGLGTRTAPATTYFIQLAVNGFILYQTNFVTAALGAPPGPTVPGTVRSGAIFKGLNIASTTANVVITVSYPRSLTQDQNIWTTLKVTQYNAAYDPTTGCCVTSCPALTGLDVQNNPPVCIYCNTNAGLVYNPNNGTCTCASGFYLDSTKTFQCYACSALYCSICNAAAPAQCTTCVVGAILNNVTLTCTCGNGFYVSGTQCLQCPYQCQNCTSPNGACAACVDPVHRDITQNCKCVTGFFDSGAINCTSCSQTCLTCTNSSACTSCDATKFRNLSGTVCNCFNGYYELYNANQTRTCLKCNPECLTCSVSPASCLTCDPKKNRVPGVASNGVQTCSCLPGYYSTIDGSCIQSNCNADPFCSQCEQGLNLCVQCLASKNRIISLPAAVCVCMDGYYANANNTCVACPSGCSICSSATNCTTCAALAVPSINGVCLCPNKTYFAVSPDGVRYCAACGPYCLSCIDINTCATCASSYTKTADNKCICSPRNFIDTTGNCLPCANGCLNCTSATVCNSCVNPLVLQGSTCQPSCNNGFTALGSICTSCPTGCLQCTQNLLCYYCADNYYAYNGNCYSVCPAGTVGDRTGGNWNCIPCNTPCKTCINHPSYCTSCLNGFGYLQTSAVQQSCVLKCVDGTYVDGNGVCQVCDFRCGTCVGSATNCISCPQGQILYQGGCWASCPAIYYAQDGLNATCTDSCPDGYWKRNPTSCQPCAPQCTTCSGYATNCTSCLQGSVSTNGTCSVTCGENQFSFSGICVACSASCYGCATTPQNCLQCASGYVKTGSICQKGCLSYQFYDNTQKKCIACSSSCATCSAYNYCTTCANAAITPRGGVCSSCPYPCSTCDGTGACTTCLSGFYFFQGACQTACPPGANPVNGVCQCASGIVSNGQCVTSCGSGFTSIGGSCQPCNSNCAQCSGSINKCTACISGYSIDATTATCVSSTQCPYGQQVSNGVCTSICDSGFYFYEGICIYGGCFSGYVSNSFGGCVRQTSSQASVLTCNPNQYISNGQCVGSCPSGFFPDSSSRQCQTCSANCVSCFSASYCIICNTGFTMQGGVCTASSTCPSTQYQYNSACVSSCPIGTYTQGSQCQRTCPANNYYLSQICYITCPTTLRTNEACVSTCPNGTNNTNGVCA